MLPIPSHPISYELENERLMSYSSQETVKILIHIQLHTSVWFCECLYTFSGGIKALLFYFLTVGC